MLYGRASLLREIESYKVRPCANELPAMTNYQVSKWEMGTQNYEGVAGAVAAMEYLAGLGNSHGPGGFSTEYSRESLNASWELVAKHELSLSQRFVSGLKSIPGCALYGISEEDELGGRTSTFSIRKGEMDPAAVTQALNQKGIWASYGNFYAQELSTLLGLEDTGYVTRVGFLHYNTLEEVDRTLEAIESIHTDQKFVPEAGKKKTY